MYSSPVTRRRFLNILGASTLSATLPINRAFANPLPAHSFSGEVMGGVASMTLVLENQTKANALSALCFNEVRRLEKIFSLFIPGSAIRELNEKGKLINPSVELVEVIHEAQKLSELSDGAFDITLQPVWKYLFYLQSKKPDPQKLENLKQLVDYKNIKVSNNLILFSKPGMEITLNGIAQGYITDKVTALLRANGMKQVLVELGETYALGKNQNDNPWRIGIKHPEKKKLFKILNLENQALATSGGYGTRFNNDQTHHLINPKTGTSANYFKSVSVVANKATHADGLSTTLSLLERTKHNSVLKEYKGAYTTILA